MLTLPGVRLNTKSSLLLTRCPHTKVCFRLFMSILTMFLVTLADAIELDSNTPIQIISEFRLHQ